jgi:hypothetical protein
MDKSDGSAKPYGLLPKSKVEQVSRSNSQLVMQKTASKGQSRRSNNTSCIFMSSEDKNFEKDPSMQ